MLDMIEKTKTVDIFNYVCQMRKQRTHMVQVEVRTVGDLMKHLFDIHVMNIINIIPFVCYLFAT